MRAGMVAGLAVLLFAFASPAWAASEQELAQWFEKGYRADAGDGVPQDDAVAFEWYLKAAEGGHIAAMRNLAGMYGGGRGTEADQEAAARWFRAAAEGGDAQGQYAYANWYVQDEAEKIRWLQLAAAQGHEEAIALLAGMNVAVAEPEPAPAAKPDDVPLTGRIAAVCVQRQLTAAGYDIGAVDGDIGRRSIAAAGQYAQDSGLADTLGALTPGDAEKWCRALAADNADLAQFLATATAEALEAAAAYGPAGDFRYQIAGDVPEDQVDLIRTGIMRAEAYLSAHLGGGIPEQVRRKVTVKIVATGRGNEEPGGGNGAATAFAEKALRPFFDVANAQWNQNARGRGWTTRSDSMKTVAHEYAHIWQGHLGAISGVRQPLPGWINEGLAEYLGYRVMIDAGEMKWADVRPFVLNGALQDQLRTPLDSITVWPGHAGFVAIDWLVEDTPNGLMGLRIMGEEVGKGASAKAAFKTAFGLELDDFYQQFEAWRQVILQNPSRAFDRRPALVLPN